MINTAVNDAATNNCSEGMRAVPDDLYHFELVVQLLSRMSGVKVLVEASCR
jgi:hypothetical protein